MNGIKCSIALRVFSYINFFIFSFENPGASLVAQWLRLCVPNAGGLGLVPGQGTRSRTLHLRILHATTKTHRSQINK